MRVPFLDVSAAHAELRAELTEAYERVFKGGQYVLGPECEAFETEFAAYCGTAHCVGVSTGLDALHLILRGCGIGPGDDVLVPSNTFIATWLAVSHAGAMPVPVEPDPHTYNLQPAAIEQAITPRTRAVVVVHLYGQPADMDPIRDLARATRIRVIEDAAQAHGARYRGRRAGALADAAAFSFYPAKNLGALGDGGAITTDDGDLAKRIRLLRNYGASAKYRHEVPGFNSRLDELQAAFLRAKLRHLDDWNHRRSSRAAGYLRALQDIPGLVRPTVPSWADPSWHLFVVRCTNRDAIQRGLRERGIDSQVHYPVPPHLSGAYAGRAGPAYGSLALTERLASEVLSLPIGPHLSPEAVTTTAHAVGEIVRA